MHFIFGDLDLPRTCNAAPVQYEGILPDGSFIYFRARFSGWRLTIAQTPKDALLGNGRNWDGEYGTDHFAASWMPVEDAEKIIVACVNKYYVDIHSAADTPTAL